MKVVVLIIALAFTILGVIGPRLDFVDASGASIGQPAQAAAPDSTATCPQAELALGLDQNQAVPAACNTLMICEDTGGVYDSISSCRSSCPGVCSLYGRCCDGRCIYY